MTAQSQSIEALARPLIEQCRREIAAAWAQIEAAKDMLRRSRWLLARWAEQSGAESPMENERLARASRSEAARIGMFVTVPDDIAQGARGARRARSAAQAST
jgi:hypothetical protein